MSRGFSSGPRTGSMPRQLLEALAAAPDGTLSLQQAVLVLPLEYRTARRFESAALTSLETRWQMAAQTGNVIRITPAGTTFLRQCALDVLPADEYAGQVAQARTAPAFKPLQLSRLMQGRPARDGMDDYRDTPSLMGGARVAFRGGVK